MKTENPQLMKVYHRLIKKRKFFHKTKQLKVKTSERKLQLVWNKIRVAMKK